MAGAIQPFTVDQAWVSVAVCVVGTVYALWFRHQRAALGFVLLSWLALGFSAASIGELAGWRPGVDPAAVAAACLPWNLLMASLLPAFRPLGRGGALVLAVLAAQYLLAGYFDPAQFNARLAAALPDPVRPWLSPPEPVLLALAGLFLFVRWQRRQQAGELALCLTASLMVLAALRPESMFFALLAGAGLLLGGAFYATHRMAFIDPLTGLANRRALEAALANPGRNFAIGMLDIDHFKRINDRHGHDFGDQVLRMVAARIRRHRRCRPYRYGGEEFCLLFRTANAGLAKRWCEEIRLEVGGRPIVPRGPKRPARKPLSKRRHRGKGPQLKVTVSIGLALGGGRLGDTTAVLEAADKALYRAKRGGRDRVSVARS